MDTGDVLRLPGLFGDRLPPWIDAVVLQPFLTESQTLAVIKILLTVVALRLIRTVQL